MTNRSFPPQNTIARFNLEGQTIQNMGKHLKSEDAEQFETKIKGVLPRQRKPVREGQPHRDQEETAFHGSRRIKNPWNAVGRDPTSTKLEFNGSTAMEDFNSELKEVYLDKDMDREEAKKELVLLVTSKQEFREPLERHGKDPRSLRGELNACEIDSLKLVRASTSKKKSYTQYSNR